jgi:hypothetical protein
VASAEPRGPATRRLVERVLDQGAETATMAIVGCVIQAARAPQEPLPKKCRFPVTRVARDGEFR